MNILHLSDTPLSNAPANIAHCQRACGHEARVLLCRNVSRNGIKHTTAGELWTEKSADEITELFDQSDVIHAHNFIWELKIFQTYPHLVNRVLKKKYVIQYHSDRHSGQESFEPSLKDPAFDGRRLVLAQYHARMYPECTHLVGNPLPLDKPEFEVLDVPLRWQGPYVVSFAPSNVHITRGWDYKGADKIIPVLKSMEGQITPEVLTNLPYEECLARKRWAAFGVEELVTGSYHLSFLEYMALGCVTFGWLDIDTRQAMARLIGDDGARNCPYIQTKPFDLAERINDWLNCYPETCRSKGLEGREWIDQHWSMKSHVDRFDKIYASV